MEQARLYAVFFIFIPKTTSFFLLFSAFVELSITLFPIKEKNSDSTYLQSEKKILGYCMLTKSRLRIKVLPHENFGL